MEPCEGKLVLPLYILYEVLPMPLVTIHALWLLLLVLLAQMLVPNQLALSVPPSLPK